MVGVTLTALLAGSAGLVAAERGRAARSSSGSRLALVRRGGTLSVFAVWSLVGNQALFAAREAAAREGLERRHATHARRAQALLFWSHEPDLVLGDAAAGLGDREGALRAYREAVDDGSAQLGRVAPAGPGRTRRRDGPPRTTGCMNSIPSKRAYRASELPRAG